MMQARVTNSGLVHKKPNPRATPSRQPSSSFFFLLTYEDEFIAKYKVDSRTEDDKHEMVFDKDNSKVTFCGCRGFKFSTERPKKCAHAYELYRHHGIDPEKKVWPWLYLLPF